MDNEHATEADAQKIASEAVVAAPEDAEARLAELEAEKVQLETEKENYRLAYLKESDKNKSRDENLDETEEQRLRRITREEIANSRLSQIDREKEELLKKTLKENKELKAAHSNKKMPSAAVGTSTEETAVVHDSSISPDQLAFFKAKGWDDKKIAQYKKNLQKRA